jgi:hypothetical protein
MLKSIYSTLEGDLDQQLYIEDEDATVSWGLPFSTPTYIQMKAPNHP